MGESISFHLTRHCVMLGAILAAMWLAAINYDNNVAYLVLFLIFSLILVSAVHSDHNLRHLRLQVLPPQPVFAGETVALEVMVTKEDLGAGVGLTFAVEFPGISGSPGELGYLEAGQTGKVIVSFPVLQRGRGSISRMEVSSLYPLGLLRLRRSFSVETVFWVYPRPHGDAPWPESVSDSAGGEGRVSENGDDFYGLRPFRAGESLRRVDWKAVARGRALMIKEFSGGSPGVLWLEWNALETMETERRISQLAQWVIAADSAGGRYGLRLPHLQIPPSQGAEHRHACLRALALA